MNHRHDYSHREDSLCQSIKIMIRVESFEKSNNELDKPLYPFEFLVVDQLKRAGLHKDQEQYQLDLIGFVPRDVAATVSSNPEHSRVDGLAQSTF